MPVVASAVIAALVLAGAAHFGYRQGLAARLPSLWLILVLLALGLPASPTRWIGLGAAYILGFTVGSMPGRRVERTQTRAVRRFLQAIDRGELENFYQPILDFSTKEMIGVEALARWNHPTRGLLPPAEWLYLVDDLRVMDRFAVWSRDAALRQAQEWPHLRMSINVVPARMCQNDWSAEVLDAIAAHGLSGTQVTVEVTEGTLLTAPGIALDNLTELRRYGVKVALDDFGTGFASLKYLTMFPFDYVKIDRAFIVEMSQGREQYVRVLADLARSLGLDALAEGVENEDEAAAAAALGCRFVQGYHYGRPMPAAGITALIETARGQYAAYGYECGPLRPPLTP